MITPIPSDKERFKIRLGILSKRPFELGIALYDKSHANSYYFRRKALFLKAGIRREFIVSMPVSPELLEMELYDKKDPLDDSGFEVVSFKVEKMPSPVLWARPAQHRFLDFAIRFSQKAGYAPTGFYESENHEFLFQYLPSIRDTFGKELITPARTHRKMPRVQISQRLFKGYTIPIRVAILAHEGCHWFLNTRSQTEADLCGMRQYLDYGFPTIEAVYAVTKVFGDYPELIGASQIARVQKVIEFIEHYKTR